MVILSQNDKKRLQKLFSTLTEEEIRTVESELAKRSIIIPNDPTIREAYFGPSVVSSVLQVLYILSRYLIFTPRVPFKVIVIQIAWYFVRKEDNSPRARWFGPAALASVVLVPWSLLEHTVHYSDLSMLQFLTGPGLLKFSWVLSLLLIIPLCWQYVLPFLFRNKKIQENIFYSPISALIGVVYILPVFMAVLVILSL